MATLLKMLADKFNGLFIKVVGIYSLCIVFFCVGKINDNSIASYIVAFVLMNIALLFLLLKSYYDNLYPKKRTTTSTKGR